MRSTKALPLLLTALAATLPAQSAPGKLAAFAADTVFTEANLTSLGLYRAGVTDKRIVAINFTKTPSVDSAGQYTASLTLYNLSPTYGGAAGTGQMGVVQGQYDTRTTPHTFTPTTISNALNSGSTSTLMIEPWEGICCAVERSNGIYFSLRTTVTVPFPTPIRVTPGPGAPAIPGGRVAAVPCFYGGNLVMLYADGVDQVVMRPMTLGFAGTQLVSATLGAVTVFTKTTAGRPGSPTPIIDDFGDVRALLMTIATGADSDLYFQASVTPQDPPLQVLDTTGSIGGSGVCGGRFFAAATGGVQVAPVAWLAGSDSPVGQNAIATLTMAASNSVRPFRSCPFILALSTNFNAGVIAPIALPGIAGEFALAPSLFLFNRPWSFSLDEVAEWDVLVPNTNALRGVRISVQGIASPNGQPPVFTNSSTLSFY